MSSVQKFLAVAAFCAVVGASGIYWVWTTYGPTVGREFRLAREEGEAFGRAHGASACVDEVVRRIRACGDVVCELREFLVTRPCLRVAAVEPGFCADVPESLVDAVLWTKSGCPYEGVHPEICERLLRDVVQACARARGTPS